MKSYGVPLKQARRLQGHAVPYVVERILDHLQAYALDQEGLFRVPGDAVAVLKLKHDLDDNPEAVDLSKYELNTVAEALKKFFAELPEPLVPSLIDQHVKALFVGERKSRDEIMAEIKFAVDSLSEECYALLERLTDFMAVLVSFASRNKMNLANLAACIAPTLKFTPAIFTYSIQYHTYFFGENQEPLQIPHELKDMASSVNGADTDKSPPRNRDTPSSSVPLRTVTLVSDPNFRVLSNGTMTPKDSKEVGGPISDASSSRDTSSTREMPRDIRDGSTSDGLSIDTPRSGSYERESSSSLQERKYRERDRERERERDREREREDRERDRDDKKDRETSEARNMRRKSRRASPSHQSSEDLSGQDTAGANSDNIISRSSRHRYIPDSKYESSSFAEVGKSRSGTFVNGSENEERQQKKKYYKEELAKLKKICDFWKNEAQANRVKLDEMTDKTFDLESQLKKQKLKNKDLFLDIEMLEHKLRRAGIEVTRMESRDEEDRREDARDERRKEDGTRSRGGAEGVSPPPSALPSSRRRRSISIDPNDISRNSNGTGPVTIDFDRLRRKDKRISLSPDSALHDHRSRSSSHIDTENRRSDISRRSTYISSISNNGTTTSKRVESHDRL